ncbi:MAG: M20 family metallopeptidase [Candidatus Micrarchaeota archaeon]|nr:M20 family metallopeptidase [Candidatus Micrarchaeota archaeon]
MGKGGGVAELAKQLVGIKSESAAHGELRVARFIKDYLDDIGIDSSVYEFEKGRADIVASIGKGQGLMLNGHMDTVPVGDVSVWSRNPYGEIKNGDVYGRGASDMKGGIASALAALKGVDLKKPRRRLVLAFVADEEVGFGGSLWLLKRKANLLKGVKYGIISEPTDMKLQIAQKGIANTKITFRGVSAHGSKPWLGRSAVLEAVDFINEFRKTMKRQEKKDRLLGSGTFNVGRISGGTAVNVVAEQCWIGLDRRIVPGETTKTALRQINGVISRLDLDAKVEVINAREPFALPKSSQIAKMVMDAAPGSEYMGATGYTEAELYKAYAGIDCLVYGPGIKEIIHKPDEYVPVKNLERCARVYGSVIGAWCGRG